MMKVRRAKGTLTAQAESLRLGVDVSWKRTVVTADVAPAGCSIPGRSQS